MGNEVPDEYPMTRCESTARMLRARVRAVRHKICIDA